VQTLHKYLRPVWIVAAAVIVLFIAAWGIATVYLNSAAFRRKLIDGINAAIAGQIEFADHQVSLLSGRLTFTDIRLKERKGSPLAGVERLQVSLLLPALVWREIRITRLELHGLDLQLHFDHQDQMTLMQVFDRDDSSTDDETTRNPWQVRVDDFQLFAGRLDYFRPRVHHRVLAESVELGGSLDLLRRAVRIRLKAGRIDAKIGDIQQVLEQVTLTAFHLPDKAKPISLALQMPDAELRIQGRLDWELDAPDLDLDYGFDVNLAIIHPWIPQSPAFSGKAAGRGTVRGAVDDPSGELKLEISGGSVDHIPFNRLAAQFKLERRQVTISALQSQSTWGQLDLTGSIDLQAMFPESWQQNTAGLEKLAYDLTLRGQDLMPGLLPLGDFDWNGRWQVNLAASGTGLSNSTAAGSAMLALHVADFQLPAASKALDGEVSVRLTWANHTLEIQPLTADLGGNRLHVSGQIDFSDRKIKGSGELEVPLLADLGQRCGAMLPAGQSSLTFNWHGDWQHPAVQATLLARDLALEQITLGRLIAEANLGPDGMLRFSRAVLENQGSLIEGRGTVALRNANGAWQSDPAVALELTFAHLEPSDFRSLNSLQGIFSGKLNLDGTVQHPIGKLDLSQSKISWGTLAGHVQGNALWQDGNLKIPSLKLAVGQSVVHLKGGALWRDPDNRGWTSDPLVTGHISESEIHLEDLHPDYAGLVTVQAGLSGRLADLQGEYRLTGSELDLKIQKLWAVSFVGRIAGQRLFVDDVSVLLTQDQGLKGQGWYAFDGGYDFLLNGEDIELHGIDALQLVYPIEGRMTVRLQGDGSVGKPTVMADIQIADPIIKGRKWDDFHIAFGLREQALNLDAQLNFMLKAHGRIDNGDFGLQAHFDQSDLTPYLALWLDDRWAGRITGDLQAEGNWHQTDKIHASASVTSAALDYQSIPLLSADKIDFSVQKGTIDLPETSVKIMQNGYLDISAAGSIRTDMRVQADGRIPLAAMTPFLNVLADAEGELQVHANARGPMSDIQWHGDLTLTQIGFAIPTLAQTIDNLNGHVGLSPQAITIESLTGELDGGLFSMDGRLGLDQLRPTQGEVALRVRNLPLHWPDTMDAVVSGDLNLKGEVRKALLSGHLDLVEGTYYKDVRLNLLSAVTQPRRGESVSKVDTPAQWMEAVELAVSLGYRNPFLVDNNMARLLVVPDLNINGTLARPLLDGRAEVTDGEIIFRGKSFAVKTGVVDFVNPYKIEPTLDIVGTALIRQWQVTLSLSGTPDQLVFELSSDPPESDNDILSLILFGRTQSELTGGDTSGSQTTTQMLAALVATAWGDDLKNTTGMDILELETGTAGSSEDPERIQVTVGKNLGRRLTIKYAVETTDGEMIQRAISEYRF
jgi:autotransporter translocation and assembly factor TamB